VTPLDVLSFEPDALITLDFETYYAGDYTLTKLTTESYVRDPRFEVIGVSVKVNDADTVWFEEIEFRVWAASIDWSRCAVLAHNCTFDSYILAWHYGIIPGFYFDTLSMGRALHGTTRKNNLASLAAYYGLGEKGDEVVKAKGKRRKDFTEKEWLEYGLYCVQDTDLCKALFDVMPFPEVELWNIDTTIRLFTEPQLVLNEPFLAQYLVDERKRKADLLARINQDKSVLMSGDKFAALLIDYNVTPPRKISVQKTKRAREVDPEAEPVETWAFAKNDSGMQELLEHETEEVRWLAEARVAIKSTINETRSERMLRMGAGGRALPVQLNYAGAHTFRWSGAGRTNFQNLERTNKRKPQKGALRKSLEAPKGKKVVVADSNAIEARGTAWFAEETELVEAFAQNRDPYNEFGSKLYGRTIDRKKNPEDEIPGAVSKVCILGLGYSMGWFKFAETMLRGPMGADPIRFTEKDAEQLNVRIGSFTGNDAKMARIQQMPSRLTLEDLATHCAVAERIVYTYRDAHPKIRELWKLMDEVLGWMEAGEEVLFGPSNVLQTVRHGILLPNGLILQYPGLAKDEDDRFSYISGHGKERVHLYGGLMTENIIQALARIVVSDQMLMVRGKYGYKPALMTHDELVLVVPDAEADLAKYRLITEMRTTPDWAVGLPLSAEGGIAQMYGGAK